MEMSCAMAIVLLMMGLALCIGIALTLEVLYRLGVRRYERNLDNSYAADFEHRADALALHLLGFDAPSLIEKGIA